LTIPDELPELGKVIKNTSNNQWLVRRKKDSNDDNVRQLINMQLRQYVTELLLQLQIYRSAQQRFNKVSNWRDLMLERSRTLYEQEVRSDLGDSMAQQTKVQFQEQQIRFCQTLAWAQLNALQGRPVLSQAATPKPATPKAAIQKKEVSE